MRQECAAIGQDGPAPVTLRPINVLPLAMTQNQEADPLMKLQFWTYKPAVSTTSSGPILHPLYNPVALC